MEIRCSVLNCGNAPSETTIFYQFPPDFDTCMQWVQNTGSQQLWDEFSDRGVQPFLERHVCSDHFLDIDFAVFGEPTSGLTNDAIPFMTNLKRPSRIRIGPSETLVDLKGDTNNSNVPLESQIKLEPVIESEIKLEPVEIEYAVLNDGWCDDNLKKEKVEAVHQLEDVLNHIKDCNEDLLNDIKNCNEEHLKTKNTTLSTPNFITFGNMTIQIRADVREAQNRNNETPEERAIRLEKCRIRIQKKRKAEDEKEKSLRRQKAAIKATEMRAAESEEKKRKRREQVRIRVARRRQNMTPEEKEHFRLKMKLQARERRKKESEEEKMTRRFEMKLQARERRKKESEVERITRRYQCALRASKKRSEETPEQTMERRLKEAVRAARRRKTETEEERQERLRKNRERVTLRRMEIELTETPEEREERLRRDRERMYRKRHGLEYHDLHETLTNFELEPTDSD